MVVVIRHYGTKPLPTTAETATIAEYISWGTGRVEIADTQECDVLIVGGGMVGASLACALGALPLRVMVVEAVPWGRQEVTPPSYDDRVTAIAWGSRGILDKIGIWPQVGDTATAIRTIQVSERGNLGVTRLTAGEADVPALGYVLENRLLGQALAARLAALEGVSVLAPARMSAWLAEPTHVTVTVQQDGNERRIRTRLLVAADGGRSAVREALGVDTQDRDYGQCAVVANVTPSLPHHGVAYERFTPHGPLAMLPLSAGRCNLVWTLPAAQAPAMIAASSADFRAALQEAFGWRLGRIQAVGTRLSYPLSLLRAKRDTAVRTVLIGNAAHTLHPVAGQGFNLGLRDVAALAESITQAWRAGEDIGSASVLERYSRQRQRDQRRVASLTDGLVRVFAIPGAPAALVRAVGLMGLDACPTLKRLLIRQTTGLAGRLPRLARSTG